MLKNKTLNAVLTVLWYLSMVFFVCYFLLDIKSFDQITQVFQRDSFKGILIAVVGPFLVVAVSLSAVYYASKHKQQ